MEKIYTGREKNLHYKLAKKIVKSRKINIDDIAQVSFKNSMPTEQMPLWTLEVIIDEACNYHKEIASEKFYLKNCAKHGFSVTWRNLKKGNY